MSRMYCTNCRQSIYNCTIEGKRVPLAVVLHAGQPGDTGPMVDLLEPGLKIPSMLRSLLREPLSRVELCVACFAEIFGLPCVEASEDPLALLPEGGFAPPTIAELDPSQDMLEQYSRMHQKTFQGVRDAHDELVTEAIAQALDAQANGPVDTTAIINRLRAEVTPAPDVVDPETVSA